MIWIKKTFKLFLPSLIAIIIALVLFEFYLLSDKERFHSYGWVQSNKINEITDNCLSASQNKTLGIFGDSFVEYYRGSLENISNRIKNFSKYDNICNFGVSGSGLEIYYHRFVKAVDKLPKMNKAIIFLFEGNDFVQISEFDENFDVTKYDRSLPFFYEKLKKSAALNFIWREIFKRYFIVSKKFNSKKISERNLELCTTSKDFIDAKLNSIPKKLLRDFETHQLNTSLFRLALSCPDFFKVLNSEKNAELNYPKIYFYIKQMNKIASNRNINLSFVIIPSDFYFKSSKRKYWIDTFQFNEYEHYGKTIIPKLLLKDFDNISFAETLNSDDYLNYDGHLNPTGVNKLAKWSVYNSN